MVGDQAIGLLELCEIVGSGLPKYKIGHNAKINAHASGYLVILQSDDCLFASWHLTIIVTPDLNTAFFLLVTTDHLLLTS